MAQEYTYTDTQSFNPFPDEWDVVQHDYHDVDPEPEYQLESPGGYYDAGALAARGAGSGRAVVFGPGGAQILAGRTNTGSSRGTGRRVDGGQRGIESGEGMWI
ncbi:hypothetical protein V8D89_009645 [Ganoderma adspersum]